MKVMILALEFTPELNGGLGTHVWELARGLGQVGHQVTVLAFASGESKTLYAPNVAIHLISPTAASLTKSADSMVQGILSFNDDLADAGRALINEQEEKPDIIQYYSWITFRAALQLQRMFDIPLIGMVSYISDPVERWWGQALDPEIAEQEKILFKRGDRFIAVSHWIRTLIQTNHAVSDDRIYVVHNGLDVRQFIREDLNAEDIHRLRGTIANPDQKIVLFAGRLNLMKGISALFASAAEVVKEKRNVRYLIVGEADSRDFDQVINQLFQQYPILKDKAKMLGKVPRRQLALLYLIADIFVMPSLYEPFAWVAVEAMAAGLPVVSVNAGGTIEIVKHGWNGLLVPIHPREAGPHEVDVLRLAEAQIKLLNDEVLAKEYGNNGRQHVLKNFNLEKMIKLTVDAYRHTISAS
jgi:glycosyltransferase involved in cell wall biosynthesis